MKQIITTLLIMSAFLSNAQSFEIINTKDTINFIDKTGKKQGNWILMGKHKPNTCYAPQQKAEEGAYQDNRKGGNWLEYFCNGKLKNNIPFVNGRPDGHAIIYYENGNKKEEGDWKLNKWVGNYKSYYDNGTVQHDFKFNEGGKREGIQIYNYENGQVAVQGNFANGKEAGIHKEYYESGDVKAIKTYNNGNVDIASIKTFETKKQLNNVNDADKFAPSKALAEVKKDEIKGSTPGQLVLNGKHILYNKNKQVSKDGLFKDNRLMEGKAYIYNDNGILTRVAIYKNGVYIGDAAIEN